MNSATNLYQHVPLPIGKFRLVSSIIVALPIGVLLYLAATNLGWFTLTRQLYLLFGICAGAILGIVEARLVIAKLVNESEAVVWQIVPFALALFGIPLVLSAVLFGSSEYYPFGAFAFLPAIPTVGIASGWYFSKFEKVNNIGVFASYFGFKYWTQPNPDHTERFNYFLSDVASKDPSNFWGQIGSSYAYIGYAKIFIKLLKEKQDIDPETREQLIKLLKFMNSYRVAGLSVLAGFLLSTAAVFGLFFGSAYGYLPLNFTADVFGPACMIIFLTFAFSVITLTQVFRRKISKSLLNINSKILNQ